MAKQELREIPKKNYIIVGIICVVTILLTFYINAWIKTIKTNKENEGYLDNLVQQINLNELDLIFTETNDAVLYVGNKKNTELEKKLFKVVKKYDYNDNFYYLPVDESIDYIKELNKSFKELDGDIRKEPLLIKIDNGKASKVIDSRKKVIKASDLEKLINE